MRNLGKDKQLRPGLAESIRNGTAVPIISDEAIFGQALVGHKSLAEAYADYTGYELDDINNLPRIARCFKLKKQKEAMNKGSDFTNNDLRVNYLDFVKNFLFAYAEDQGVGIDTLDGAESEYSHTSVTGFARLLGYPRLAQGAKNPLLVLANKPFRVYLTTSPYRFLEKALEVAGKTPRTTVIPWRNDLRNWRVITDTGNDDDYHLDSQRPLVCHLFGLEDDFRSLVLTEDDYLDFLVDVNLGRGDEQRDSVPAQVRRVLSGDLLVLGFSLNSWAFRALYAGLIKSEDERLEKRGIAVQLPPSKAEKAHLHDYLIHEAQFEPIWKDFPDFAEELRRI